MAKALIWKGMEALKAQLKLSNVVQHDASATVTPYASHNKGGRCPLVTTGILVQQLWRNGNDTHI